MSLIGWILLGFAPFAFSGEPLSLTHLENAVTHNGERILSFQLEGTVKSISEDRTLIVLEDHSTTTILRVPPTGPQVTRDSYIRISTTSCRVSRTTFNLDLGSAPVVEIDGRHSALTKSGSIFLKKGKQPVQIHWFNGFDKAALSLEYEGPGVSRQLVTKEHWWRKRSDGSYEPGLDFQSFSGEVWHSLPDFNLLNPVAVGITPDLDVGLRQNPESSGLTFSGFIEIQHEGIYTFHLKSDDGARLLVGDQQLNIEVLPTPQVPERPIRNETASHSVSHSSWATIEGLVTFMAHKDGIIHLEVLEQGRLLPVTFIGTGPQSSEEWMHRKIQATGLSTQSFGQTSERLVVIAQEDIKQIQSSIEPSTDQADFLSTALQVRRLQPSEASKPYRATLRGVVTTATPDALVLQDHTGGVYIRYAAPLSADQPKPGESWEVIGLTNPGFFSPEIRASGATYLGLASLPDPVKPTWEQLMNGSLDAEYVEIEGIVLSASLSEINLLTRDGEVTLRNREQAPLPILSHTEPERQSLAGSLVRLRGVFTAHWDPVTRWVIPGEFSLGSSMISIDEPAPTDPFSISPLHLTDLKRFTSHAHALKRVKIAGLVLHVDDRYAFLSDGQNGLRFIPDDASKISSGDQIEVVGFPRFGGPSPILLEARSQKTGTGPIPAPTPIDSSQLPDPSLDSTLIRLEGTLVSDTIRHDERLLEVKSGSTLFVARMKTPSPVSKTISPGSLLRLTGVYASGRSAEPWHGTSGFALLVGASKDLEILKKGPWWSTRHTFSAIAILSGGLAIALVWAAILRSTVAQRTAQLKLEIGERQRIEQFRAIEKERTRVARDLHDELGAGLTEAGILSELARNPAISGNHKESYLSQLSGVCRSLVSELDEIVWAINPRYDSTTDLASYSSLFAQRFLNLAEISCRLKIDESLPELPLDAHVRHEAFLVIKEALNNVVKHSGASTVILSISLSGRDLKISVQDDGRGLTPINKGENCNGLASMKRRMQKLGGTCRIESQPGHGTHVEFHLPTQPRSS